MGIAVKVTGIPAQTGFTDAIMDMLTAIRGSTVTTKSSGSAGHNPFEGVIV